MYQNINFKDKKILKSNFHKNKKVDKIDDVDCMLLSCHVRISE